MGIVSLLHVEPNPRSLAAFAFEHDMAHRALSEASNTPQRILDPPFDTAIPGSLWHLDHQQLHNDLLAATGVGSGHNLRDWSLINPSHLMWWTFVNHHEHYKLQALNP